MPELFHVVITFDQGFDNIDEAVAEVSRITEKIPYKVGVVVEGENQSSSWTETKEVL